MVSVRQRLGEATKVLAGRSDKFAETYQKVGLKVAVGQFHMMRVELMSKALPYINDKSADIADRVDYLDELIALVGQPWGRARSDAVWARAYGLWQDLMTYWRWFESQRKMYEPMTKVVVQQLIPKPVMVALENGGTTTKIQEEWSSEKVVSPETYLSAIHRDQQMGEKESMKLIRVIQEEALYGDDDQNFGLHPQFNKRKARQVVTNFGEREVITCGMIVLNFAWHEMDVTVQSVDVIVQPAMQGQGQGAGIYDARKLPSKPQAGGDPGIQQT